MKKVFFLFLILIQQSYACWQTLRNPSMMVAPIDPRDREHFSLNGNGDFASHEQIECATQFREKLECKDPFYFAYFRERLKFILNKNPNLLKKEQIESLERLFFEKFCEIIIDEGDGEYKWSAIFFSSLDLIDIMGSPVFSRIIKKYSNNNVNNNNLSSPVQKTRSAPEMGFSLADLKSYSGNLIIKMPPSLCDLTLKVIKNNHITNDMESFYKMVMSGPIGNIFGVRKIFFECLQDAACESFKNREKQKKLAQYFSSGQLIAIISGYLDALEENNATQQVMQVLKKRRSSTSDIKKGFK